MKLMYKINFVALAVLVAVGLAIAAVGVSTISRESYNLNKEVMTREINNVLVVIQSGYDVLAENRLEEVESYQRQAQSDILDELKSFKYGKTGLLMIVTGDGEVLNSPDKALTAQIDFKEVDSMVHNRSGGMGSFYQGKNRFYTHELFPQWNWQVILSITNEEMLAARDDFIAQVFAILLLSLLLGTLIFVLFIRRIVEPIRNLADATAYVSEGKWDTPLPTPKSRDEVAQLTISFRRMAHRLAEMYGNLQQNLHEIEKSRSALLASEEKYRGLVELLPLVVYEITPDGQIIFVNQAATESFGYSIAELVDGFSLQDLLVKNDNKRFTDDLGQILSGTNMGILEYTGKRLDHSTFPCIVLASPTFHSGNPAGIRGIVIDITERKTLEQELKQAREFLDSILNNVADPVFVKDTQHRFILVNDAFCNFIDHTRQHILGKTDRDFFLAEEADSFWQQDDLIFSSHLAHENEDIITGVHGEQQVILTKRTVFKDNTGVTLLVGIIKDITRRKKMEQELFKSDKLQSIGVLAGGIAHDFNNILTAIIGNLSLAKMLSDPDSKLQRHLTSSLNASNQAKDLTQQLLTFSKGGAPVKQTVSLNSLIEELVTFTLSGSSIRCEFSLAEDLWPVEVDEGQISRVLHNLMVNAVQAMKEGGTVHVFAHNHIHAASDAPILQPGKFVRLQVRDHGIGIPRKTISNIFDPYFTTKENGSGLGLATAFSIIKRHDGHIEVASKPDEGTTFTIYLPASAKSVVFQGSKEEMLHKGVGRILIMDDDSSVREVAGEMLELLGYEVKFALDGAEAITTYSKALHTPEPFDIVIMDLTIPGGIGGQEAMKKLLAIDPNVKAIVASGYSSAPVMANFKSFGFSAILAKPFELQELSRVLHRLSKPLER